MRRALRTLFLLTLAVLVMAAPAFADAGPSPIGPIWGLTPGENMINYNS